MRLGVLVRDEIIVRSEENMENFSWKRTFPLPTARLKPPISCKHRQRLASSAICGCVRAPRYRHFLCNAFYASRSGCVSAERFFLSALRKYFSVSLSATTRTVVSSPNPLEILLAPNIFVYFRRFFFLLLHIIGVL